MDLVRLMASPADGIDTSEVSELEDGPCNRTSQVPFYQPVEQRGTVCATADTLARLKSPSRAFQPQMSAVLRQPMLNAK